MKETAIILFADLPEIEASVKSFCSYSSNEASKKISSILTNHFLELTKNTDADAYLIDSYKQKGSNFGEKIANAFNNAYKSGYKNVICIGNDCPDLTLSHLNYTIDKVQKGKVVLGPTTDGGVYIIAIPYQHFNKNNFQNIKWQTSKTFKNLGSLFNKACLVQTEVLSDIDCATDLLNYKVNNALIRTLLAFIENYYKVLLTEPNHSYQFSNTNSAFTLRGPPKNIALHF